MLTPLVLGCKQHFALPPEKWEVGYFRLLAFLFCPDPPEAIGGVRLQDYRVRNTFQYLLVENCGAKIVIEAQCRKYRLIRILRLGGYRGKELVVQLSQPRR